MSMKKTEDLPKEIEYTMCYIIEFQTGEVSYCEHCCKTDNIDEEIKRFNAGHGAVGDKMVAYRLADGKGHALKDSVKILQSKNVKRADVLRWFGYIE